MPRNESENQWLGRQMVEIIERKFGNDIARRPTLNRVYKLAMMCQSPYELIEVMADAVKVLDEGREELLNELIETRKNSPVVLR